MGEAARASLRIDHAGYVVSDDHMRTNVEGVWALGDITNPVQLKHVANHEAKVVAHNLTHPTDPIEVDHRVIPHAVFGNPQVASVGLNEHAAHDADIPHVVAVQPYGGAAYGWAMEDTTSFMKVFSSRPDRVCFMGRNRDLKMRTCL